MQIEILSTTRLNVQTVAILTGSAMGAGTLCFICGALFGMLCCRIIKQTKTLPHETVPGIMASNSANVPVYEDIKLDDSTVLNYFTILHMCKYFKIFFLFSHKSKPSVK